MNSITCGHWRSLLAVVASTMLPMVSAQELNSSTQVQLSASSRRLRPNPKYRVHLEQAGDAIQAQRRSVFAPNTPKTKTPAYPSSSQIQAEEDEIESQRKGLFSDDNAATHHAPRVFPNVAATQPNQIDIEALARRYQNKAQSSGSGDDLVVFASFSMPAPSLRTLVASVSRFLGGRVVLRGFKNDSYRHKPPRLTPPPGCRPPASALTLRPKIISGSKQRSRPGAGQCSAATRRSIPMGVHCPRTL